MLFCFVTQNLHIVTMYIWITLRLFQAIDAHSGYGAISDAILSSNIVMFTPKPS
jgi:hypothetical protein